MGFFLSVKFFVCLGFFVFDVLFGFVLVWVVGFFFAGEVGEGRWVGDFVCLVLVVRGFFPQQVCLASNFYSLSLQ